MSDFAPDVKRILKEHGCEFKRHGKGDHDIWWNPRTGHSFPVDSTIKSRHAANGIMKQADIDHKF
ncbi:type II toxin-antitoxin system HicA family toxin [Burkholderia glumae]|uniref:type II toxin-antitoxin system HicA family toxin n=1 Tax=Burkholderia glumae TaxID=337 RepID=UPI0020CD0FAD|nr:type II toxin-antitoxin system HicA family toxin [Burkholderia glumae]MCQ0029688.1 type II toxin-antitoxin system HicA family toxin [Burkholderia glumae]MCQ0035502.1 type II toxin-antitoxin system HicA family toxin [Burkholderia glumae]